MATTVGVDRDRGAPVDQRQKVLLLLGTLTASVTFQAGLSPPGGFWSDNGGARIAGSPFLHTTNPDIPRYLVSFFYCNATAFVASLAMILLHMSPVSSNQRIYALRVTVMILALLSLIGAYVAGSCFSLTSITISAIALAVAVLPYIAIQIPVLLCKPVEILLRSVQESPQKCPKLLLLKKKKFLLKAEQKNHIVLSGQGTGDAYQILEKSRKHMLLLGTLVATITYQAGLNPPGSIWEGEAHYASGEHRIFHGTRYLVFLCCNASAFLASLAIILILLLSSVFSTHGLKYYRALQVAVTLDLFCLFGASIAVNLDLFWLIGAYVAVNLDWFCLIGAYVVRSIWQLVEHVYISMFAVWPSIYVVIQVAVLLLLVLLCWVIWRQALREKTDEQCFPDWLKKLFGLSTDGHAEEEERDDDEEEEEEEEGAVAMELNLEQKRKLLLLLAILAAILAYHASTRPPPDNLVNYRLLAFSYCKAAVFVASLSIIAMLANRKLPAARSVRWHAMRVCVILDVIGLTGTFAARGYWKISTIDVLVLILAVLLCIAFQSLLSEVGFPTLFAGPDPLPDDGTHDFEVGMTGGTNEEPLGVEIASPILGGALTLIVAVPVISIVDNPVKLLVGIMIASIGVGLWRRSLARLLRTLASVLQRRQGTTPSIGSSSSPPEHGLCKLIHTLCSGTWMWIIILVIWVPSLRHNLRLKFKVSSILAVLGVLVVSTPTPNTPTAGTAASTTTTATMETPSTATSTVVATPITAAAASGTSTGRGVRSLVEQRPRRNRRANSRLIGPDWVN